MRFLAAAILALSLGGCALFPSTFDSQEHARLVTISQLSSDNRVCANTALASGISREITREADWLHRYGASLGDNEEMTRMERNLLSISTELSDRYGQGEVSVVYCRLKLDNIHRATQTMIGVSARRPRI